MYSISLISIRAIFLLTLLILYLNYFVNPYILFIWMHSSPYCLSSITYWEDVMSILFRDYGWAKRIIILLVLSIASFSSADGVCPAPGNDINPDHPWTYIGSNYRFLGYARDHTHSIEMRREFCDAEGLGQCSWYSTSSTHYPQWIGVYKRQRGWNLIVRPDPAYGNTVIDSDCDTHSDAVDKCVSDSDVISVDKFGCHPDGNSDDDVDFGQISCEDNPIYPYKGNPINILNGNNYETFEDIRFNSPFWRQFTFSRFYNSRSKFIGTLGYGWTHAFSARLIPNYAANLAFIKILAEDGRGVYFLAMDGGTRYVGRFMEKSSVIKTGDDYVWHRLDGLRFTFNTDGRLIRIEDQVGNRQELSYDEDNRLAQVSDAASGRVLHFHYRSDGLLEYISGPITTSVPQGIWVKFDYANQNLSSVGYPDGSGFYYTYDDPNDVHNLSQVTNNQSHLLSRWSYDNLDRVVESFTRDGLGVSINYVSDLEVEVTDAYGVTQTYGIDTISSRLRITSAVGKSNCTACGEKVIRVEYDDDLHVIEKEYVNGRIDLFADFNNDGNPQTIMLAENSDDKQTIYITYDENNQLRMRKVLSRTEVSVLDNGSRSRYKVVIWDYDDDGDSEPNEKPTALLNRVVDKGFTRDSTGNIVAYEYVTTYKYNSKGQLVSVDGPRYGSEDAIFFQYDSDTGDLLTITLPEIGDVRFSNYDAAGNPRTLTDPNGIKTDFVYDGRRRILSRKTDEIEPSWSYTPAGELRSFTDGAERTMYYDYHSKYGWLEQIIDSTGSALRYVYDDWGNRIEESIYTADGVRKKYLLFDYNHPQSPGRLWKVINPDNTETAYAYDSMGNRIVITDAMTNTTEYQYDIFGRLSKVIQPENVETNFGYDKQNNLVSITDAENLTTVYLYDDLGRVIGENSQNKGIIHFVYDAAGNLIEKTDANGTIVTYSYDGANRLTGIRLPDDDQSITYSYDQGANGIGYLTGMIDASGSTHYTIDRFGRVTNETRSIAGFSYNTGYDYDASGLLTGITYPDGRKVTYERDPAGLIRKISTTFAESARIIVDSIDYLPFGPITKLAFGDGMTQNMEFDQQYQLINKTFNGHQNLDYIRNPVGNITTINDQLEPNNTQSFGFDHHYRLTLARGAYGEIKYSYDTVGNRLSKSIGNQEEIYTYAEGSHRLVGVNGVISKFFGYDANGNTTQISNKALFYNEHNRLRSIYENGSPVAEYTYNGLGQRIMKTANNTTTVYHYDLAGNLIGESDLSGEFRRLYFYLGNERLAAVTEDEASEVAVDVSTDEGKALSGVRVYAFSESGTYTGTYTLTDDRGIARFNIGDFSAGKYTFRADYLSGRFWSEVVSLPSVMQATIVVHEQPVSVQVLQAGVSIEGIRVYLFSQNGSYLNAYKTTDESGLVTFELPVGFAFTFRADILGNHYFSKHLTVSGGGSNNIAIESGGGRLQLGIDNGSLQPIEGISVYLFNEQGAYLGLSGQTNDQGEFTYDVPSGNYKIRADYLGYQYWTQSIEVLADTETWLTINHKDINILVEGDDNGDIKLIKDINVYLFTSHGAYQGISHTTDELGKVIFNLPDRSYKVRVDYMGQQFWSESFIQKDQKVTIPECRAEITVSRLNSPLSHVPIFVFSQNGSYLGLNLTADVNGRAVFRLPSGIHNFRADYLGNQYFSGNIELIAHQSNPVNVSTGGGNFTLQIMESADTPLTGISCYLFSTAGTYLGHTTSASNLGEAYFELADGDYKIRIDYLGYQFWTREFSIPETTDMTYVIEHHDVAIVVQRDFDGNLGPIEGIDLFLFKPSGNYLGIRQRTNTDGVAVFRLPAQAYQVRADYLGQQFWSPEFVQTDEDITIPEGYSEITVLRGDVPLEKVSVYVFSTSNAYLGINGVTDVDGRVGFQLPAGTYKFRADHQGNRFWITHTVAAHQVNEVSILTGGGTFKLTVEKSMDQPIADVPVYVFSESGAYLGISAQTDSHGQVSFGLSNGSYSFRVDHLGYQFWTDIYSVPDTLTDILTIDHHDVIITLNEAYISTITPLENIRIYVFTATGAYQGISAETDVQGQVVFNLPAQDYKVRADYLGGQFWSEIFNSHDIDVDILHGMVKVQVLQNGIGVMDRPVYLFSEYNSYLGMMEQTDSTGQAVFWVPERIYKFRVDHGGNQYWTDTVNIRPNEETEVTLDINLHALDATLNPNLSRIDGGLNDHMPNRIMLASLFDFYPILSKTSVSDVPADSIYYYINDHLGTPQKIIDEEGYTVWQGNYMPFGELASEEMIAFENNFRFPGQYFDSESSLHYNYHRYYDPNIGRYIRPDPIGLKGGMNLFVYAVNNPLGHIDTLGLDWVYSQSTGQLTHIDSNGNVKIVGTGYAGRDQGVNNPAMQNVRNVGPLPQGTYMIGPQQNNVTVSGTILRGSLRLTPDPKNQMHGRSGFLIHGDNRIRNQSASLGCPVLTREIRDEIGNSNDNVFRVVR